MIKSSPLLQARQTFPRAQGRYPCPDTRCSALHGRLDRASLAASLLAASLLATLAPVAVLAEPEAPPVWHHAVVQRLDGRVRALKVQEVDHAAALGRAVVVQLHANAPGRDGSEGREDLEQVVVR